MVEVVVAEDLEDPKRLHRINQVSSLRREVRVRVLQVVHPAQAHPERGHPALALPYSAIQAQGFPQRVDLEERVAGPPVEVFGRYLPLRLVV